MDVASDVPTYMTKKMVGNVFPFIRTTSKVENCLGT